MVAMINYIECYFIHSVMRPYVEESSSTGLFTITLRRRASGDQEGISDQASYRGEGAGRGTFGVGHESDFEDVFFNYI